MRAGITAGNSHFERKRKELLIPRRRSFNMHNLLLLLGSLLAETDKYNCPSAEPLASPRPPCP
eukprot:762488-Hanusia_phi.AAC.2